MSLHDEIGDLSGGQTHHWPGQRSDEIEEALVIEDALSGIKLDRDVSVLEPEIAAAEIARNVLGDKRLEFSSSSFPLAAIRARTIATLTEKPRGGDNLLSWIGTNHVLVKYAQELAWLSYAFQAGATAADLEEWCVSPITIQQLLWWERREGETLLSQHIRADRNGWALRWLGEAVRDTYGNLLRFVDRGKYPQEELEKLADLIAQVRELLAFYEIHYNTDKPKPEPLVTLTQSEVAAWAEAFSKRVLFVAPDARGRWGSLPAVSLGKGILRADALKLAKYFKHIGVSVNDFANLPENYFGRVGDKNA